MSRRVEGVRSKSHDSRALFETATRWEKFARTGYQGRQAEPDIPNHAERQHVIHHGQAVIDRLVAKADSKVKFIPRKKRK